MRLALAALSLFVLPTACGSDTPARRDAAPGAATTTASAGLPTTSGPPSTPASPSSSATPTTAGTATTAVPGAGGPPTSTPASPTTAPAVRTSTTLGPEWTQRDGRVLIEAVASGDPQVLLRDLQALGLTDGVVFGRIVNGWLPIATFSAAQQLASLQFVRPTGAGTG